MNRIVAFSLATASLLGSSASIAQQNDEGNLMVRIRAVNIQPVDQSGAVGFGAAIPGDGIRVSNKTIPEVDFSYFITKNIAAELILTYPQTLDVNVSSSAVGPFKAGTVKALPPILTLQYHFQPAAQFRPYVGAGINYTRFSGVSLAELDRVTSILTAPAKSTNSIGLNSWGFALQAGLDIKVGQNSYLNLDVKKAFIRTDLKNSVVGKLSTLEVDPVLVGIGYGFKF